jgi:hypothetical protein
MSGGSYSLTGRQFLTVYALLGSACERKPSEVMLYGKMRNRIEKLLRMEEVDGMRVFKKLPHAIKPAFNDGKPVLNADNEQAKFCQYDEKKLTETVGEFRFDPVERGAIFELLNEGIENPKTFGDEKAALLRIAGWLGMGTELEKRVMRAHKVDGYSGTIDDPEPESILED